VHADADGMEEFDRLKGTALTSRQDRVELRYVRERLREGRLSPSSRAERMSEVAAAARKKHRGVFAQFAAAPPRGA
jgi:hypothetical protein